MQTIKMSQDTSEKTPYTDSPKLLWKFIKILKIPYRNMYKKMPNKLGYKN